MEQRKGRFLGLNASQQTLNVGWDKHTDRQIFGISTSYTQGQVNGEGKENHRLTTVGLYYGWQSGQGWFVDAASQLMYLNQTITLDPALGIHAKKRDSHMLVGSVRTGYQAGLMQDSLLISPFVGLSAGTISGYGLQGQDTEIGLTSANLYFATSGVSIQKRGITVGLPSVNLSATIEYRIHRVIHGSKTTLLDRQSRRQYNAWSDNRYRTSVGVGVEGLINPNLILSAKVDSSFGGVFKTDYSGQIVVAFHF